MRHLIIMRHGKAERGEDKLDFDRALEPRGWDEAGSVGEQLVNQGFVADTILCSAARRTRETLASVIRSIGRDCVVNLRTGLYDAETADLRDAMRTATGQCVMLIGHNPSVHALALSFAGPAAIEVGQSFPTSTAAVFSMGFALDTVKFERLITPRGTSRGAPVEL